MAIHAPTTGAPIGAPTNVVPFPNPAGNASHPNVPGLRIGDMDVGKVYPFWSRPKPKEPAPEGLVRTPELALLLAVIEALPARQRRRVCEAIAGLHRTAPGPETNAALYVVEALR